MNRVLTAMLFLAIGACDRPSEGQGPANVLLISMDTVRSDHLSTYGYARETSPWLTRLAAHGTVFESSFSSANESAYSHAAMLTGRYATEVAAPVYVQYSVPDEALLVGEVLGLYGYQTAGFIAGGHVSEGFGFEQGFAEFSSELGFASFWHTTSKANAWLAERDRSKPYFLMVHGYDAHRPYLAPSPFYNMFWDGPEGQVASTLVRNGAASEQVVGRTYYPEGDLTWINHSSGAYMLDPASYKRLSIQAQTGAQGQPITDQDVAYVQAHYDSMVAYADQQIGLFLAAAEREGHLDNTLIIITGDHGEDLLDHDFMNHRTSLHDSNVAVPMVLVGPGIPKGHRHAGLVDALDVAPTIYAATGAKAPAGLPGRALQALASGTVPDKDTVFIEGVMDMLAVRTPTHKLVFHAGRLDRPDLAQHIADARLSPPWFALYDLQTDPTEHHELLAQGDPAHLPVAEDLRTRLVEWRTQTPVSGTVGGTQDVDPRVVEEMKEHGYWEFKEAGAPPPTEPPSQPR